MTKNKSLAVVDSMLLCEYILERAGVMTHLKLQKLLYYTQALHLAFFDKPIIEDDFQAWLHGPVSRKVYDRIKSLSILYVEIKFDSKAYDPAPSVQLEEQLAIEQFDLIKEVIDSYKTLTSSQLENLSHSESPWIDARKGYDVADRCEVVITQDSMRHYYKQQLYGQKK